jgi:hypothetical protein
VSPRHDYGAGAVRHARGDNLVRFLEKIAGLRGR